jgi:hypothetical protein
VSNLKRTLFATPKKKMTVLGKLTTATLVLISISLARCSMLGSWKELERRERRLGGQGRLRLRGGNDSKPEVDKNNLPLSHSPPG